MHAPRTGMKSKALISTVRGNHMKTRFYAVLTVALVVLGGCASYDQETHQEVNAVLDGLIQLMDLATQAVTMMSR
jgi:hypothetical protein